MIRKSQIQEHMEVLDKAGHCLGRVDHLQADNQIRVACSDPRFSQHRFIPLEWVERLEGGRLMLGKSLEEAEGLDQQRLNWAS